MILPTHDRAPIAFGDGRRARRAPLTRAVSLLLLFAAPLLFTLSASAQSATKKVLILSGTDPNHPGFSIITQRVRSVVRDGSAARVELLYELQEGLIKPPDSPHDDEVLAAYLKRKYGGQKIDLIFSGAAPRLRILLKNNPDLFAGVPKVFYDFEEERELTYRDAGPHVTGVWARVDLSPTLEIAFALQPEARRVVVVAGNSPEGGLLREKAKAEFRKYEGRAEFVYLSDLTLAELKSRLATLPSDNIVFYLTFYNDRIGNKYPGVEALSVVAPTSAAPIYGNAGTALGSGIIGGSLLDTEGVGQRVGEVCLRILNGERPEDIPSQPAPNVLTFDWRELKRWGIGEEQLPPGSVVMFKEFSFWELYRWYIVGTIAACIIEALLIAYLLIVQRRRRLAERERERLAGQVAAEHRRLNETVSNVPGIVWETLLDPRTDMMKTVFVSDYVEKMLDYTPAEWLSSPPGLGYRLMNRADRERTTRASAEVMKSGGEAVVQHGWRAKDGRPVWVESRMSPMFDEAGKVVGLRGVSIDITEKKLAEDARRQSEERNLATLRAIPDMMFLLNRDGVFLEYHARDTNELYVPPGQFIGKNIRDVLPPELAELLLERFSLLDESGDPQVVEYELDSGGQQRWFEARLVRSGEDLLSVVHNITDRRLSEEALRQSEERFRNMADTAPVLIWMAGPDKLRTYFNKQWLDFTGRSLEEELGEGWVAGIHPEDHARYLEAYAANFDRREPFKVEYRLRRADGASRWMLSTGTPRFSSSGQFLGYIGSSVDIHDRKESEEALLEVLEELSRLKNQLHEENVYLREEIELEHNFSEIVGRSDATKYVLHKIEQVAPTDSTVLITGETGTGKELVARAVHGESHRRARPLVKVNCSALSPGLIESELFGHERGAFTGATGRKAGRFEVADGATIFLDEIGELPLGLQSKLLRVIQEGEFERLGGNRTTRVDVRIIAATNRNLWKEVQDGAFREDLFYRLNVFPITVPPLRQRAEDIPLLVEHFVGAFSRKMGKRITSVTPPTLNALCRYAWPGNVRELANVIERAVINNSGPVLQISNLSEALSAETPSAPSKTLEEMEREYIVAVLDGTGWRIEGQRGAARILGLHPSTLRTRMAKLKVEKPHLTST